MDAESCKFEEYVRHLAATGVDSDDCGQLQGLINKQDARGVRDHLSSWVKTCAGQLVDLVEEERKAKAERLVALEEAKHSWSARRDTLDKLLEEGWRQHWLLLWGYVGQQSLEEERYKALVEALDYALGHSRKGKNFRKRLAKLLPPPRKTAEP